MRLHFLTAIFIWFPHFAEYNLNFESSKNSIILNSIVLYLFCACKFVKQYVGMLKGDP